MSFTSSYTDSLHVPPAQGMTGMPTTAQGMVGRPTNEGHNPAYNLQYHANPLGQQVGGGRPLQNMFGPFGQPVHAHQHDPSDTYGPAGETFLPLQPPR